MSEQKLMSDEEKYKLLRDERHAIDRGDMEEVLKIRATIPIDPELADSIRKIYGLEYLKNTGYDLSEAEAKYGKEWSKL